MRFVVCALLGVGALGTASAEEPEAVLARMRARQAELKSLRASLEQTKSYPQLGIEDPPEQGHLYVERSRGSARVRIEIETPEPRILAVKNGAYVLYQPRIRQAVEGKASSAGKTGLFSGLLTGSAEALAELEQSYTVEALAELAVESGALHHLRFTARPNVPVHCQQIDLYVDPELWLPVRQACREANDSVITFSLGNLETDVSLDAKLFELEIPEGVERVKG